MTTPGHAPIFRRQLRPGIGVALTLGCLFAGARSHGASEDPAPDRAATADEVRALADKIDALTSFCAVYEVESKVSTGVLTLNFRGPNAGHLSVRVTEKKPDDVFETDSWMLDCRFTFRAHSAKENLYTSASYREPFEFAENVRAGLSERLGGMKIAEALTSTHSFCLNFGKYPDDADEVNTNASLLCDVGKDVPRVKWFMNNKVWDSARRIGDRIVVEQDGCRYRFAIDTGFLADATIAESGTVKLRELSMKVDADEFVPSEPDPKAEDKSAEFQRTAWRVGLELARDFAWLCLAEQDEAGKLDDVRLEAWKSVLAKHYERWFPPAFSHFVTARNAAVDKFLDWRSQSREAAHGDAAALEALETETKKWRDAAEADGLDYIDRFAKSFAAPPDTKIPSAVADRGLDAEREAVRAAGRKALVDPLLQRFDEGVAAIDERK